MRPSRETDEDPRRQPTWRTGERDRESAGRPQRSFTQRSRDTERSADRYGREKDSFNRQPRSDNVRRDDRAQGSYSNQRQTQRDDYGSKRMPRSSPFGKDNFENTRDASNRSANRSQGDNGPNRKERRAATFGTKTWSDTSRREGRRNDSKHARDSPFSFGLNQSSKEPSWKPASRTRDRPESSQDYRQDADRTSRRRGHEQDGRRDAFDEVKQPSRPAQPRVKVPLSIPYTTAGSEFLYGTHVVKAALQSGRRKLYKLYIYQGVNGQGDVVEQDNSIYKVALAAGVTVAKVSGDWERLLNKMSDQRPHNGYVLEASPIPKLPVTALEKVESPSETFSVQLGHQSAEELAINSTFGIHGSLATLPSVRGSQRYPFIVMLDRIRDPGNLGSIIRSAFFLGAEAIILIEHGTAPIGPVALKSSASAAEYLPLLMVKNEHAFMRKSQESGWKFFAATSPDSSSASGDAPKTLELNAMNSALREGPCVLLLGSEGEGIRPQLQRIVNGTVGVESARGSAQGLDSLNVGVAAALLMQEFLTGPKHAVPAPAVEDTEAPEDRDIPQQALEKVF